MARPPPADAAPRSLAPTVLRLARHLCTAANHSTGIAVDARLLDEGAARLKNEGVVGVLDVGERVGRVDPEHPAQCRPGSRDRVVGRGEGCTVCRRREEEEEEKEIYYNISVEMILAQPSSHSVQTTPAP